MILFEKKTALSLVTLLALLQGCGGGGSGSGNSSSATPHFTTEATRTIQEGVTSIATIQTDTEGVTFAITGGVDADKFTIDPDTGTLKFKTPQDFENPSDSDGDGTYEVTVTASKNGQQARQRFYITLTNNPADDGDRTPPHFTSAADLQAEENEIFHATVHATDNESNVTYTIDGGPDAKRFRIDPVSGDLTFYHLIPDFEISSDANNDKIYKVTVAATDREGNKATQDISVAIQDDPTDSTYGTKKVYKTGLDDGGHGEVRTATANGDDTVTILERYWEDTAHVNTDIDYYSAHEYCAQLELGSKTDWRLPTRRDLYDLVDYAANPKIDAAFTNKNGGYFWTSQELFPYDGAPGDENNQTWTVQFGNAIDFASDKTETAGYHVRCVRGNAIPNGAFSGTLTIIDSTTGIEWENNTTAIDPTLTWEAAKTRCENLVLDGKNDWRLPNISELHSIIPNNDNEYQFTDLTDQKTGPYWSASQYSANAVYYVENYWDEPNQRDVQNDALINPDSNGSVRSRCIRGGN